MNNDGQHVDLTYRSYLMCAPDYFKISYEINPWMQTTIQPNLDLAYKQWCNLVENLERAGAEIVFIEPVSSLPDMVFTADVGYVDGSRFFLGRFHHLERSFESTYYAQWFQDHDYELIAPLSSESCLEGGDVMVFRNHLIAAHGFRSDLSAHLALAQRLELNVVPIRLVDPRFYHLDTCFCRLDDRRAIVAPCAWDRRSCERVQQLVPEPLVIEVDEALTFCTNSVIMGTTIIMPDCPPRVSHILEKWGFDICISPVSEFLKAGGGVHCLTLDLGIPSQKCKDAACSLPRARYVLS